MAVAGATAMTGVAAAALTFGGIGLALGAFGYAVYKAIPRAMHNAHDLVGQSVVLSELPNIYPALKTLAILGPSRSGKTTLKNRLQFKTPEQKRTTSVTATIVAIPTNPVSYLAVLDGGGEKLSQQFKIAEPADFLCLVVDHNTTDSSSEICKERQEETVKFMSQIREHLTETECDKKTWICILANKRDLWGRLGDAKKTAFTEFVDAETEKWGNGNYSKSVSMRRHSNENVDDVSTFMDELKPMNSGGN